MRACGGRKRVIAAMAEGHFHVNVRLGSRAEGDSAAEWHDYLTRRGQFAKKHDGPLVFSESGNMPTWAADDPRKFWEAADRYERANGALYHTIEIALPLALNHEQQLAAARENVAQLVGNKHPYTFTIHGNVGNPHFDVMFTARTLDEIERGPELFFKRANGRNPERGGCPKVAISERGPEWVVQVRKNWEEIANRHLRAADSDVRIDHRSYKSRGIDKAPGVHLGPKSHRLEKRGKSTWRGLKNREAARLNASLQEVRSKIHQKENINGKRPGRSGKPYPQPQQHRTGAGGSATAPKRAFTAWRNDRGADRSGLRASKQLGPQRMPALRDSRLGHGQQEQRDAVLQRAVSGHRDGNNRLHSVPGGGLYAVASLDRRQLYKAKLLQERYQHEIQATLAARLAFVDRQPDRVAITLKGGGQVTDHGDRLLTQAGLDQEIRAALELALVKGWTTINLTGSAEFKTRAWLAASRAGLQITGYDPSPELRAQLTKERTMLESPGGMSLTPNITPDHQQSTAERRWGSALERARHRLLDEHRTARARLAELRDIDIKKFERDLAAEYGGAEYRAAQQAFRDADAKTKAAGLLTRKRAESQRERAWQAVLTVHASALSVPAAIERLAEAKRQNREREQLMASLVPIKIGLGEIEQWQREILRGRDPEAVFVKVWQRRRLNPLQRWHELVIAPVFEADAAAERSHLQAEANAAEALKTQARQAQAQREIAAQQKADELLDLMDKPGLSAVQEVMLQEQHRFYSALAEGLDEAEARERSANPNHAPRLR